MKTKRNKKRYNFTEKQLRRARTVRNGYWNNVPSWYTRILNRKFKSECNMVLRNNIINGTDKPYPRNVNDARWWWY